MNNGPVFFHSLSLKNGPISDIGNALTTHATWDEFCDCLDRVLLSESGGRLKIAGESDLRSRVIKARYPSINSKNIVGVNSFLCKEDSGWFIRIEVGGNYTTLDLDTARVPKVYKEGEGPNSPQLAAVLIHMLPGVSIREVIFKPYNFEKIISGIEHFGREFINPKYRVLIDELRRRMMVSYSEREKFVTQTPTVIRFYVSVSQMGLGNHLTLVASCENGEVCSIAVPHVEDVVASAAKALVAPYTSLLQLMCINLQVLVSRSQGRQQVANALLSHFGTEEVADNFYDMVCKHREELGGKHHYFTHNHNGFTRRFMEMMKRVSDVLAKASLDGELRIEFYVTGIEPMTMPPSLEVLEDGKIIDSMLLTQDVINPPIYDLKPIVVEAPQKSNTSEPKKPMDNKFVSSNPAPVRTLGLCDEKFTNWLLDAIEKVSNGNINLHTLSMGGACLHLMTQHDLSFIEQAKKHGLDFYLRFTGHVDTELTAYYSFRQSSTGLIMEVETRLTSKDGSSKNGQVIVSEATDLIPLNYKPE